MGSLALTCGCYEDGYAEFEWDSWLDNTPQPLLGVNPRASIKKVPFFVQSLVEKPCEHPTLKR